MSEYGCDVNSPVELGADDSPVEFYPNGFSVGFGGLFGNIGHFFSNVAKTAGREIGKAEHTVMKAGGAVEAAAGALRQSGRR